MINTRFWNDSYISALNPTEKLLFLYFLTNPWTNICGIYELPLKNVVVDTGVGLEEVRGILTRFTLEEKIMYIDGWVIIRNFIKHQKQGSPTVLKGIQAELEEIPKSLIGYAYPIDTPSHLNTNLNTNSNSKELFERVWSVYPKKVGKLAALKAFEKLNPTEEITQNIIFAIESSLKTPQWQENDGRYIPHAATFLNRESFEDAPEKKGPRIVDWEQTELGMKPILG